MMASSVSAVGIGMNSNATKWWVMEVHRMRNGARSWDWREEWIIEVSTAALTDWRAKTESEQG